MMISEQFFRGVIRAPGGDGEHVIVAKATRALAERMATTEAKRHQWDWVVEHCRVTGEEERVLERWSGAGGHEVFCHG